eukprot:Skav222474  [mRNA]  locus=scaffold242:88767:93158:+ [translate_table: standard]
MSKPLVNDKVYGMAQTAEFWIPPTGPMMREYKGVHVLVKFDRELGEAELPMKWMRNHCVFKGKCCQPALPEIQYTPKLAGHQVLDKDVIIIVDSKHASLIRSCRYGLDKGLFTCMTECTIQVFQGQIMLFANGKHSGVAVWSDSAGPISRKCAELFAGGFGGWSHAMRTSQKLVQNPFTCQVAIDCDACAINMFSANHDAEIIPSKDDPRCYDSDSPKTKAIVTHIQDGQWFHWIALSEVDIYLSSPPCPAWSFGADMAGYMRTDGQQTLQLAKVCRLTQPKVVLVENVNGFQSHPHFSITVSVFRWAGYLLRDTFDSDLADVSPASRRRWIGTFVRKDIPVYPVVHEWFKAYEHDLDNFGFALLNQPEELLSLCILNDDMLKTYGDRRYLPTSCPYQPNVAHEDVIDVCNHRLVKPKGKFGVFMSLYGRQHDLSEDTLKKKKLFAELMPAEGGKFRLITPIEQALCYMVDTCEIPKDLNVAYACIGNAISPPQAIYAMHMLETILGVDNEFTPMDLVVDMVQSSLRPENVQVEDHDDFWKISRKPLPKVQGSPGLAVSPPTKKKKIDEGDRLVKHKPHDHGEPAVTTVEADAISDDGEPKDAATPCAPTAIWTDPAQEQELLDLPENPVLQWFSVTFLMPFDTMTLRVPKGSDPCQILIDHGFQVDYCNLRDLFTGERVEGQHVTKDMVIDVHTDHESEPTVMKNLVMEEMGFLRFVHEQKPWTNVTIAYRGHTIWKGTLPHDTDLREIHDAVSKAFYRIGIRCDLRWTNLARALNPFWGWKLNAISQAGTIKLHVHLPVIGGGGNANAVDDDIRNQIIALLASHPVPFTNLVTSVAQICYTHKPGVIKKALQISDSGERWKAMIELGKTAGVTLRTDDKEAAATKIQKIAKKKGFTQQAEVDVTAIKLIPGAFKNADGSDAKLSSHAFSANGNGVVLATISEISPWVQASRHLSMDEFCAIVPGHHSCDTKLAMQHIQCQAIQADSSPLLFKATMIQFGEKVVSQAQIPGASVDCPKSMVIAMTVHWDEFQDQWNQLVQKPAKYVLAMFSPEIQEKGVVAVWGQRFQLEGQKCAPSKSDSVQFHCRIKEEYVNQTLKESGHNSVYTIPKDEQLNKPDSQYAIVWTGSKKFDAELQAKEYAESLGIVRNRRMFGYRILYENFQEAWEQSFPDRDVPKQVRVQQLFKILNIPIGFTHTEVGKWLEGLTWAAKAIKRLGAGTWLVGAEKEPPQQACLCNGQVVIVQKIEAKRNNQNRQVLVGTPIPPKDTKQSKLGNANEVMLADDAWANYRAQKGLKASPQELAKNQAPRDIEGPTAARLTAQDQKIDQISKKLAEFESKTNDAIKQTNIGVDKMVIAAQEQTTKIERVEKRVEQKIKNYQQKTDQQLTAVQSAIAAATQANQDQFRVLREMLQASAVASSIQDANARKAQKRTPKGSPRADNTNIDGAEEDDAMKEEAQASG